MSSRRGIAAVVVAVLLAAASVAAFGRGPMAVRKQAEASMLVTGRIQVDREGKVAGYTLDHAEKLPAAVTELLGKHVPTWKFEPVLLGGRAVNAETGMSIRVVAKRIDADNFRVGIRGASFGDGGARPEEQPRAGDLSAPDYPYDAARAGVAGTVYLLVRVERDGQVGEAVAEQTNLRVVTDERSMEQWRRRLEDVSIRKARQWKFVPPSEGAEAGKAFWVVRVPVVYSLDPRRKGTDYGTWEAYIPGPRHASPWDGGNEGVGFSPDTLAPGMAHLAGSGLKLTSALSGT